MARFLTALTLLACLLPAKVLRVKPSNGPVTTMDREDYVAAVLAGECGGFRSAAALEAMAITARTYARHNAGRHRAEGFDLCLNTHCQLARPARVTARLRQAAASTEGMVLWARGRLARVFYHAHCGGHTETAGVLWRQSAAAHLVGAPDASCARAGSARWTARIAIDDFQRALGLPLFQSLKVIARSPSGRVTRLSYGEGLLTAGQVHRGVGLNLGWNLLRSTMYSVRVQDGHLLFEGSGRGHGVGLCQTGADERGKAGQTAEQILAAYFPGTRVGVTAQDLVWTRRRGERIEAEVTREPDAAVLGPAEAALKEAEKRTGLRCARAPLVRVYPDIASYRDATGEPGFIAASLRRGVIRLQPLENLRAPGVLPSVLLHEMLHLLISQDGPRMPLWEEEGRVQLLAGEKCAPAPLKPGTEQALASPANLEQLRQAYRASCSAVAWKDASRSRR